LGLQFASLWLLGFLRQRVEPETAAFAKVDGAEACRFPEKNGRMTYEKAREDILRLIAVGGSLPSGNEAAARWEVRAGTASKWLQAMRREGIIIRRRIGANHKEKAILAASAGLNRNGAGH